MTHRKIIENPSHGFTLVEVAVVIVIIGLILGGLVTTISFQVEQRSLNVTRTTVDNIKEALLAYAMSNGRFPCPAVDPSLGLTAVESPNNAATATVACTNPTNGFVPGVTLGLTPTNANGYVLDGWNNPIRYAIAQNLNGANYIFTNAAEMSNTGMPNIVTNHVNGGLGLLYLCSSATGITALDCGTATQLSRSAVAVVYSLGKNG